MAKVLGLKALHDALSKQIRKRLDFGNDQPSVIVGYVANYAVYVHENTEMDHEAHGCGGQSKYLEQPAREMKKELGKLVVKAVKNGAKLQHALFIAGYRLQRESQLLVPVDTGNLKGSAFTRKEPKGSA